MWRDRWSFRTTKTRSRHQSSVQWKRRAPATTPRSTAVMVARQLGLGWRCRFEPDFLVAPAAFVHDTAV